MKDLKFEQKGVLSRGEVADLFKTLAEAFADDGRVELEFGPGVLSVRVPDRLRSEVEVETGDGEVEIEIELTWAANQPATTGADGS
ncbi:amphi-Trp domain-containing protein [Streptacidiphilus monticola]|uniref:Amphi-Trp domain-containing protein n=1 Tax=Streptacidiphilus monticola TaxID=2161674 RepID=A0ABW1G6R8_9ACTN